MSAYSAAMAAQLSLTRAWSREPGPLGITVNRGHTLARPTTPPSIWCGGVLRRSDSNDPGPEDL